MRVFPEVGFRAMWRTEEYSGRSTNLGQRCQVSAGQARVTGPGRGRGGADNRRDAVHLQEAVQEFGGLQSGEVERNGGLKFPRKPMRPHGRPERIVLPAQATRARHAPFPADEDASVLRPRPFLRPQPRQPGLRPLPTSSLQGQPNRRVCRVSAVRRPLRTGYRERRDECPLVVLADAGRRTAIFPASRAVRSAAVPAFRRSGTDAR